MRRQEGIPDEEWVAYNNKTDVLVVIGSVDRKQIICFQGCACEITLFGQKEDEAAANPMCRAVSNHCLITRPSCEFVSDGVRS